MKKKMFLAGAICCMLSMNTLGNTVSAATNAVEIKTFTNESEFEITSIDSQYLYEEPELDTKLKAGCVVVNVKPKVDAAYKKLHTDWKARAKKLTKKGTKDLYDEFNIYFKVGTAGSCTTINSTNAEKIYIDFANNNTVSGSTDMIVGISGRKPKNTAGISYLGKVSGGPRVLIFATTYKSEAETVQHEIGHTYDLEHCNSNCVMTAAGFGYLNKYCAKHRKEWNKNRKYY